MRRAAADLQGRRAQEKTAARRLTQLLMAEPVAAAQRAIYRLQEPTHLRAMVRSAVTEPTGQAAAQQAGLAVPLARVAVARAVHPVLQMEAKEQLIIRGMPRMAQVAVVAVAQQDLAAGPGGRTAVAVAAELRQRGTLVAPAVKASLLSPTRPQPPNK